MNERIKLLAEQAGATVMERSGWTDYGTLNLEVEKFAELIVQACGDFTDPVTRNLMMKHFGVEE